MKYFIAASILLGLAAAQKPCLSVVAQIPSCGLTCITSAASKVGCDALNFDCQCNSESYQAINLAAQSCVIAGCGDIQSALRVQSVAANVCSCNSNPAAAGALASGMTIAASSTAPAESAINTNPVVSQNDAYGSSSGGAAGTFVGALIAALAAL